MGFINPLFSVCHQKNNVRERFRHDIAHTRCFSRCIVNRKAGLASDDAYTLAAFHDIWSMFRAYHKDHQVIILHLSLEKLALEGAF